MNQILTSPLLLRHKKSVLPSPLKSAKPLMVQLEGMTPRSDDWAIAAPFISQTFTSPSLLRQTISASPSALKSPVP